jgi:hypothetical protein
MPWSLENLGPGQQQREPLQATGTKASAGNMGEASAGNVGPRMRQFKSMPAWWTLTAAQSAQSALLGLHGIDGMSVGPSEG